MNQPEELYYDVMLDSRWGILLPSIIDDKIW